MDLDSQCIAGYFPPAASPAPARYPLELVRCDPSQNADACGLLQLRHSIRSDLLYDSYWYRSGINRTMTLEPARDCPAGGVVHARDQAG